MIFCLFIKINIYIFNFNNLFLNKGCGHKLTHTNNNETSISLFPVCYQSLSIILFCSRSVKSHIPQRFVLRHCFKNLTMGYPLNHSEHLFYAGWVCPIITHGPLYQFPLNFNCWTLLNRGNCSYALVEWVSGLPFIAKV